MGIGAAATPIFRSGGGAIPWSGVPQYFGAVQLTGMCADVHYLFFVLFNFEQRLEAFIFLLNFMKEGPIHVYTSLEILNRLTMYLALLGFSGKSQA